MAEQGRPLRIIRLSQWRGRSREITCVQLAVKGQRGET